MDETTPRIDIPDSVQTEEDLFHELEQRIYADIATFNGELKKTLQRVHKHAERTTNGSAAEHLKYIRDSLRRLEEKRQALNDAWLDVIQAPSVESRVYRKALRFRLNIFNALCHDIYINDVELSRIYTRDSSFYAETRSHIVAVKDVQYISWALLRDPRVDVFKALNNIVDEVLRYVEVGLGRSFREEIRGFERAALAHAATRSLFEERGFYLSAPPDPWLDIKYGVDLVAIRQRAFLAEVEKLDVDAQTRTLLLEDVGSYGNGGRKDCWIETVRRFPSLAQYVTLIQVKSHPSGTSLGGSNVRVGGEYLHDTVEITPSILLRHQELLPHILSGVETPVFISGMPHRENGGRRGQMKVPRGMLSRAVRDFLRMKNVIPGARLSFINMSEGDAHRLISRRTR